MLLKSPGGKKAAAALYRAMKKGKGLAKSTEQGIKRDLRPGYKELMGKGRRPSSTMGRIPGRKADYPSMGRTRHPGTPTGIKVKDTIPGVRVSRNIKYRADGMPADLGAAFRRGNAKAAMGARMQREGAAREMMQGMPKQGMRQVNPQMAELFKRFKQRVPKQAVRKPTNLKAKAKARLRPAYNKIRNLRRRLKEKGLV